MRRGLDYRTPTLQGPLAVYFRLFLLFVPVNRMAKVVEEDGFRGRGHL